MESKLNIVLDLDNTLVCAETYHIYTDTGHRLSSTSSLQDSEHFVRNSSASRDRPDTEYGSDKSSKIIFENESDTGNVPDKDNLDNIISFEDETLSMKENKYIEDLDQQEF